MVGFLVDLFSSLVDFLTGVLPQSPFSNLTLSQDVHNYLGWLNWIVPIGDMLTLFGLVLAAYLVARVAIWLVNKGVDMAQLATGGKS